MSAVSELSHVLAVVCGRQVQWPPLQCGRCKRTRHYLTRGQMRFLKSRGFLRCSWDTAPMYPMARTDFGRPQ